jgi:nucleotide-binding universal stress UspA family protein
MKTILAPIDYSAASDNALKYAVKLAKATKAKLVLLHVYEVPLPTAEAPVMVVSPEEMESENEARIKELRDSIAKEPGPEIQLAAVIHTGFVSERITQIAKTRHADIIVMGLSGKGNLKRMIMGSNTTAVLKKSKVPVLIIPQGVEFSKMDKLVYASNLAGIGDHSILDPIKDLANIFDAEIMIFNARKEDAKTSVEAYEGIQLEKWLGKTRHSYWTEKGTDVVEEIAHFMAQHKAGLIALVAHNYPLLESMIHRSVTKQVALQTNIPMLSIHN